MRMMRMMHLYKRNAFFDLKDLKYSRSSWLSCFVLETQTVTCFSFSSFIHICGYLNVVFLDRKRYFTVKGRINCTCQVHRLC